MRDSIGQLITFAAEIDPDASYTRYVWVRARAHDTIAAIAARRGHPELAASILALNKGADVLPHPKRKPHQKVSAVPRLHTITQTLRAGAAIRLPGGQFVGVELDDRGWFASSARCRVHRCFRESIRGPEHRFLQIEVSKPVAEALEGCRLYPLATAEDGHDAA